MVFTVDENHFSASLIPAVPLKSLCIMGKSGDLSPTGTQTWRKPQPGTQSSVASQAPSPCYGTLTWGKWPFKCRRFSQRGGQKKKKYSIPLLSSTLSRNHEDGASLLLEKQRVERVQFVPLTSSDLYFNHRERSGGPFALPSFAAQTGGHSLCQANCSCFPCLLHSCLSG